MEYRRLANAYGLRTDYGVLNTSLFTSPFESCYGKWDNINNLYVKMSPEETLECSKGKCDLFYNIMPKTLSPYYTKKQIDQTLSSLPYKNAEECKEDSIKLYNNWKNNKVKIGENIKNLEIIRKDGVVTGYKNNKKEELKNKSEPIRYEPLTHINKHKDIFLKTFIITTIIGVIVLILIIVIPKNKI